MVENTTATLYTHLSTLMSGQITMYILSCFSSRELQKMNPKRALLAQLERNQQVNKKTLYKQQKLVLQNKFDLL